MSVFKDYSKYYDLLYSGKDYEGEVNYILHLFKEYSGLPVKTILNLGCGTGKHDEYLSKHGHEVTGADFSADMIEIAQKRGIPNATFLEGDVRTLNLETKFDAVLSLFHVASYQLTNKDLYDMFLTAKNHLNQRGLFIFDFWYGPSVINEKPTYRERTVENDHLNIKRITHPTLHPNENIVDVHFDVEITDKKTSEVFNVEELHKMRYLFLPELRQLLQNAGLIILKEEEWMTHKELGFNSWNACIIAKK
jgi:SAM-dependent methyltransferase